MSNFSLQSTIPLFSIIDRNENNRNWSTKLKGRLKGWLYIFPLEILSTRSPFSLHYRRAKHEIRGSRKADVILVHDRLEASRLEPEVDGRFTQLPAGWEVERGTVTRRDATKEAGPPRIKLRSFASSRSCSASHRFEREREHHPVSGLPSLLLFLSRLSNPSLFYRNFLSRYCLLNFSSPFSQVASKHRWD